MADRVYEGLFILDANRYGRDPAGVSGRVEKLIEKQNGTLLVSRLWEERRLAYPIRGQRKGTYWLTYFRMDTDNLGTLTEQTRRDDNILRHLFLKVDPRIVDTLVEHAQQSGKKPAAAAESSDAAETETKSEKEEPEKADSEPAAEKTAPAG